MTNRLYPIAVFIFWLSTTSWLVIAKVVPGLRRGDPPNHHLVSAKQIRQSDPVVWHMKWNQHQIGWAATKVNDLADEGMEICTRVQFEQLPLDKDDSSSWLMQKLAEWAATGTTRRLRFDNRTLLDLRGRLQAIRSSARFNDFDEAKPWMRVDGEFEDHQLHLRFQAGDDVIFSRSISIRRNALVSDEVSPRGFMPPLRLHQQWTTLQVNPLRAPTGPQAPIVAKVERFDGIIWNRRAVETFLVVYRKDPGAGSQTADEYLGRMWVRPDDGMVLQQEVMVLGSQLTFVRGTPEEARALIETLEEDWADEPPRDPT
ncbi:MAG: hypothetical protein GTO53_02210 [Planctomycetales bacterium]|nr:hypothetical protein [Planctomycetales bacterium]NIM07982.1 hypothetical protein [Planctomycetales bacterium]NIN07460.1 hypothetical protein [Planctomycetales bacterium]NIN76566.1 hypothetical protein [Planctomycetales bacterium]NIO33754.1 hypothetical protein [Planctomycetales bacterium]